MRKSPLKTPPEVPSPPREIHIPYSEYHKDWFGDLSEYYSKPLTGRAARYVLAEEYEGEEVPQLLIIKPIER